MSIKTKVRRTEVADEKRLLTPAQVADLLGIDVRTLRRWKSAGRIKGVSLGKRCVRFKPEEIDRIIKGGLKP